MKGDNKMKKPNFFPLTEEQTFANRKFLSEKLEFTKKVCDLASEECWFADLFNMTPFEAGLLSCKIELIQEKILGTEMKFEE